MENCVYLRNQFYTFLVKKVEDEKSDLVLAFSIFNH